ncbi:MAG: hypothetical protein ACYS32_04765 [Planctomycetota bacterium]|jgi:hypothetical protein
MITDEKIKAFTRDILGCDCPEEVFSRIVCEDDVKVEGGLTISHRINIGDRLLIYISMSDQTGELSSELVKLVDSGEKERNDKGFNRFRLVLVSGNPDLIKDDARKLFEQLGKDEKIHLHIINRNDFKIEV